MLFYFLKSYQFFINQAIRTDSFFIQVTQTDY